MVAAYPTTQKLRGTTTTNLITRSRIHGGRSLWRDVTAQRWEGPCINRFGRQGNSTKQQTRALRPSQRKYAAWRTPHVRSGNFNYYFPINYYNLKHLVPH